jgi:hypothetical protein
MEGINTYILESDIIEYSNDDVFELTGAAFETVKNRYGIQKTFSGERFYRGVNDALINRTGFLLIATLNNKIYKVAWILDDPDNTSFEDGKFFLSTTFGKKFQIKKLNDAMLHIWDTTFGNVILQNDPMGQMIIFTSMRSLKKINKSDKSNSENSFKTSLIITSVILLILSYGCYWFISSSDLATIWEIILYTLMIMWGVMGVTSLIKAIKTQ